MAMAEGEVLQPLPHYIRPGLRMVFIGYNPGLESARRGHYYARAGNCFWRQLSASGLVGRELTYLDDAGLMDEAGIGLLDLCCRPTLRASELSAEEVREGALKLRADLEEHQPRVAVFSGKGIYQHFGRQTLGLSASEMAGRGFGVQPERIGATEPWVIPSSSGLASKWHRERLEWLRELRRVVGEGWRPAHAPSGGPVAAGYGTPPNC